MTEETTTQQQQPAPGASGGTGQTGGAGAGGAEPWFTRADLGLAEEDRNYLGNKTYASPAEAIKAMRTFETLARDRNAITGPTAGKELEWDGWEKVLGWTPDAAKYTLEPPKLKEGVPYLPEFHDALKASLHGARIPPTQAKLVAETLGKAFEADFEASLAQNAAAERQKIDGLKQEWGTKYDAKVGIARQAAAALGVGKEDASQLEDLVGAPQMLKLFARFGEMMGEDKLVTAQNGGQGGFGGQSPAAASAELARLNADAEFVRSLSDARHPLHEVNKAKRASLIEAKARGITA